MTPDVAKPGNEQRKGLQWQHAQKVFQNVAKMSYEANLHHDFFRAIPFQRLRRMLDRMQLSLDDQTVLVASCGNGIDVHYLRKVYSRPRFHVSDLSENAVRTAMANFEVDGSVQDNEKLDFADDSFDYCFVSQSLHHLPRPLIGLYELLRVSRKGVIAIEPNDALLTRVATKLGLATEVEPAGNYVYRISRHDVERMARSLFVSWEVDRCFAIHRVAKTGLEFRLLKLMNGLANVIAPAQGNTIVSLIQKEARR